MGKRRWNGNGKATKASRCRPCGLNRSEPTTRSGDRARGKRTRAGIAAGIDSNLRTERAARREEHGSLLEYESRYYSEASMMKAHRTLPQVCATSKRGRAQGYAAPHVGAHYFNITSSLPHFFRVPCRYRLVAWLGRSAPNYSGKSDSKRVAPCSNVRTLAT
jgi:hypothetical protein